MSNTGNTQQIIDYGVTANDGTGDPLRTAFIKTDENFDNIWLAGPVGSNITISNNVVQVNNTNGDLVLKPNGVGVVKTNSNIVPDQSQIRDLGTANNRFRSAYLSGNLDTSGTLIANSILVSGDIELGGNVDIDGNLTVNGTTLTINVANLDISDKNIVIANGSPNARSADGAGITIDGANATIIYDFTANAMITNHIWQAPILRTSSNGNTWDITDNYIAAPAGGFWLSRTDLDTEFISSGTNGFLNLVSYNQGNLATEIYLEHGFVRVRVDNGGPEQDWNFNVDGTTDFPNYTFPANDGNFNEVLRTNGSGELFWGTPNTGFISNGNSQVVIPEENGNVLIQVGNIAFWNFDTTGALTGCGNIIPRADGIYSLGNAEFQWNELWVSSNTVYIGGVPIAVSDNVLTVNGEPVLTNNSDISIETTGNIIADSFIGNGSQLTGLPAGYTDANVAAYLPSYGGNILVDVVVGNTANNLGYLQWEGNSSGDLNGYTTLKLVPDDTLVGNDQYLIIDPTAPSHIHIRAGGTQDDSAAELFLGGERNHVRVRDGSGVRLQNESRIDNFYSFSDPSDFTTATWYGTPGDYYVQYTAIDPQMGTLAFQFADDDDNRVTVYYGAGESSTLTYGGSSSNLGGGVYRFAVVQAPPSSPTSLTGIEFEIWNTNENYVSLDNNDFTVEVDDDIRITGNDTFSLRNRSNTDPITIRTDYDGSDRTWEFGADGTLSTPGDIVVVGDIMGTAGASTLVLRAQPESNTSLQLNDSVDSAIRTVANLEIRTDTSNGGYSWVFDIDGNLNVPDAVIGSGNLTLYNIDTADESQLSLSGSGVLLNSNAIVDIRANAGNVTIQTQDATPYEWSFGDNGTLTSPGDITTSGNITANYFIGDGSQLTGLPESYGNANVATFLSAFGSNSVSTTGNITATRLQNDGNLVLRSNVAGTLRTWTFDTLGDFNLPAGGNITGSGLITGARISVTGNIDAGNVIAGYVYGDSLEGNVLTVGTANVTGNVTGGNLISSATIYGDVDVVLGNIANASATKTRFVTEPGFSYIQTGNGTAGSTGNIVFSPYSDPTQRVAIDTSSGNVTAGNITLTGNVVAGSAANVDLVAGSNTWSFNNAGNLVLPGNTFAVNYANGTPVTTLSNTVNKTTGSWNVTTGTNNYSFTVPDNGVYQLWVRGNIPNGIITYTATVSVTNTNVPVIGQQFAWNYEGAGNPILFTSIPDQIIGTAGAISNANPAVGTTTNTFVFGINNSSGGNVTVEYGYTTIS
jgi:cytoskeletal protein CcmA (bactofilin family)